MRKATTAVNYSALNHKRLIVNVSPSLLALLWSDVSLSHLTRLLSRGSSDVAMNDKVAIKNEKWGMIEGFNGWLVGVEADLSGELCDYRGGVQSLGSVSFFRVTLEV